MDIDTLIGTVAGCLSTAAFVPQAWQIWKTRSARDVSLAMYAVLIAGVALGDTLARPFTKDWNARARKRIRRR